MFRFLLIAFFVVFCAAPFAVQAQDAQAPAELFEEKIDEPEVIPTPETPLIPESLGPEKNNVPYKSYKDVPEEALMDAQNFYEFCDSQPRYRDHYDCRCMGARYLDERIKAGPDVSRTQIMIGLNGECINVPGAAGHGYNFCLQYGQRNYDGSMEPEEYCQCVGNNYAILLQRARGFTMSRRDTSQLMSSAFLRCNRPKPGTPDMFPRLDIKPGQQR